MTEAENDIGTAMLRLRSAFAKHNIPCPDIMIYDDQEKAYRAMQCMRAAIGPANWGFDAGATPYGECALGSFIIRFEAQVIERPGSGTRLDDGIEGRIFRDDINGNR